MSILQGKKLYDLSNSYISSSDVPNDLDLNVTGFISKTNPSVEFKKLKFSEAPAPIKLDIPQYDSFQGVANVEGKPISKNLLYSRASLLEGMNYQMGAKGTNNKIDCSGAVCKIIGSPTMTSEDVTTHGKNFRPFKGVEDLQEGSVLGFDFGPKKHDKGRKIGIDHTGVIVKNPNTGQLEYKESVSGKGFRTLSIPDFMKKYPTRAKQVFVSQYKEGGSTSAKQVLINSIIGVQQFKDGGQVKQNPLKVYTDKKKFEQAQRMYSDSLNLYNNNLDYKKKYLDFVNKAGFDKTKVEEWNTDGYVNTEQHPKIGAISNGVLTNSGGGFERDNKGKPIYYDYFPLKNGQQLKVYDNTPIGAILNKRYSNYKKPVQPVVYQPQQTINTTKGLVKGKVIQNDGKNAAVWNSQLVQTKPTHPITNMKRLSMSNQDLGNPNIQMQGQTIPLPEMRLPQQGDIPFYGPGNTIVGYTDNNRQFYPANQYTGAKNNQFNLQDKELLNNPELLIKYVQSKDVYKFQSGGNTSAKQTLINSILK